MRSLYLIRGLPGSGKSTLANLIAPGSNFAADDYFYENGEYKFNPSKLGLAHADCQRRVKDAMIENECVIAVANTFVRAWEAEPYFKLANEFGYSTSVIVCTNSFGSVHGVPEAAIEKMRLNWERF